MNDEVITNKMLLEHMQAGFVGVGQRFDRLEKRVSNLEQVVNEGFKDTHRRFEEARQHREGLQQDLEATIKMQAKHDRELATLTGRPLPEEY